MNQKEIEELAKRINESQYPTPTGINKIKYDIKFLKFLYTHEKKYKNHLILLGTIWIFLMGIFWNFDFSKLFPIINIEQKIQVIIRLQASIILTLIILIACLLKNLSFYKKYNNPIKNLTEKEFEKFNNIFNTPAWWTLQNMFHKLKK